MERKKWVFKIVLTGLALVWCFTYFSCKETEPPALIEQLQALPGIQVKEIEAETPFKKEFEIMLTQPLDHQQPKGETFRQRLLLSHVDESKPMVLITEGYALRRNSIRELSELLGANQLRVEHRYFGDSKPAAMKWEYLNLKQATADYHRIVQVFKPIYKGKWVSAGWSKGGQTALTYRSYYPDDVTATVAYDAPVNFALEDPRIDRFFDTVGTEDCRKLLKQFQRLILKNKEHILPLFKKHAEEKKISYSMGEERAFEYIVLEYTFSFWQYRHIDCKNIPQEGASPEAMFEHLKDVVDLSFYSDSSLDSPSMYQFCTEMGYYGYVKEHVKDLLSDTEYKNCDYAPRDTPLNYKPEIMRRLSRWLQTKGDRIIYIYGESDPWSAPAVELTGKTDALKIFLKGGNHFTFINTFPPPQKKEIMSRLKRWLAN
jgi:pimeloyl-ACP methyl ester carboxylesterase